MAMAGWMADSADLDQTLQNMGLLYFAMLNSEYLG